ncbi:MAG TPA: hypothetical protein VFJ06_04845 [Halococcus sp.]|nr:hypothetical protein [Halococcus sp.]
MTEQNLTIDKCRQCEMWFVVGSVAELQRRLTAHELGVHGSVDPTRPDHRATDDA